MTDYYSEENPPQFERIAPFRFVKPYEHCYRTRAKGRWLNKQLLDAMEEEFQAYDRAYYQKAIQDGKILINQKVVTPQYIVKMGDEIEHYALRMEPPILDVPVQIVHEDDDYLVVNKPPSMIVHTGGGYNYNTLMGILFYDFGKRNLHVLHRLDRLTSGLLVFAKNKNVAKAFHTALGLNTIGKTYLARVQGDFPEHIEQSKRQIYCVSMKEAIYSCCDDENALELKAKNAHTNFKKLWYDQETDTSLIECKPVTGKTHQIRVHLKDLGYSIINDIGYGGKMIGNHILSVHFGDLDFKKISQKQSIEKLEPIQKKIKSNDEQEILVPQVDESPPYKIYEWDYKTHPLEIYLHSYKYQFGDLVFETTFPYWAEKKLPPSQI